ncbi:MAG: glycosyl hydrolase [Armatimonadota bacterium]
MAATDKPISDLKALFASPPSRLHTQPFWYLNENVTTRQIKEQLRASAQLSGFGGVAVIPTYGIQAEKFLSVDHLALYRVLLDEAHKLGLEVILYDDHSKPSGWAGGEIRAKFPEELTKRLDKIEIEITGPAQAVITDLPKGSLMGAVAMNAKFERIDISNRVKGNSLQWAAPEGHWKVMVFMCVVEANDSRIDYMSPGSIDIYIGLTLERYYQQFKNHFGKTIKTIYYDDISLIRYTEYRTWTPEYNSKYQRERGQNPICLYPALWYDIGPDTASARVSLLSFRAELMAQGFPKIVGEWCRKHGVIATGYPTGNNIASPIDLGGDNILFYQHSEMPLLDASYNYGSGRNGFKMATSSANCFDHPITAATAYGGFKEETMNPAMMYRVAMELYARGVNFMIPHGMWLDPEHVYTPPLISHYSKKLAPMLPAYNQFCARLSLLFQGGRHVADIALMYPIESMEANYLFDITGQTNFNSHLPRDSDYMEISGLLTGTVRRDFTFLHPQVLQDKCTVQGPTIRLNNSVNWEDYRLVVMPSAKVISWQALKKIQQFVENGGKLIATGVLPTQSAEPGHDADVQRIIQNLFGSVILKSASPLTNVKIELKGSSIKVYIDGYRLLETTGESFKKGRIGLCEAEKEEGRFASIQVKSAKGQLLFYEDFRGDLGKWSSTENATITDSQLILKANQKMLSRQGADWDDYTLELEVRSTQMAAGVVFRAQDEANQYMLQILGSHELVLQKKVNGSWTVMKSTEYDIGNFGPRWKVNKNTRGGAAYYVQKVSQFYLREMVEDALPVGDVVLDYTKLPVWNEGMLSYIHKSNGGQELVLVTNSSDDTIDTWVRIRGHLEDVEIWNPHTGQITAVTPRYMKEYEQPTTHVRLHLEPVQAMVVVGRG